MYPYTITLLLVVLSFGHTTCQVPPVDQCQALNATEQPECPDQIGPPCPPCIINIESDYQPGDNATLSSQTVSQISELIDEYVSFWLTNYGPNEIYPTTNNYSAFSFLFGSAGRCQIFLRLYLNTQNITYFEIAKQYFNTALQVLPPKQKYADYFVGHVGLWTIGSVINDLTFKLKKNSNSKDNNMHNSNYNKTDNVASDMYANDLKYDWLSDEYIGLVKDTLTDVCDGINSSAQYSPKYNISLETIPLMSGISGALYTGTLINSYFNDTVISNDILTTIAHYAIDFGLNMGKSFGQDYLIYESPYESNCYDLPGAAEGSGGVINQLLNAYILGYVPDLLTNQTYYNAIVNTFNYFIDIQLPDGNMPRPVDGGCSVEGNDTDSRVQWCHGAPGFIDVMSKAAYIWSTQLDGITNNKTLISMAESYLTLALTVSNTTWQRGLLIKGLMMCHGIGGNAYTLLHLYENLSKLLDAVDQKGENSHNSHNSGKSSVDNYSYSYNYNWPGIGKYSQKDIEYFRDEAAWRARQFVEWTLESNHTDHLRTKYSDSSYSVFTGSYGIPFIYSQAIQDEWPYSQPVCMPAWNLCVP